MKHRDDAVTLPGIPAHNHAHNSYQIGNQLRLKMISQTINGIYCVTVCGCVSWRFADFNEALHWAFTTRLAIDTANRIGA
ncbi:hypothetical protein [Serratia liquefaciens]|uniref:hypothetical protein n=1 Tax=Serratia liquefaciens TaxID=614 RepID=UPI0039C6A408